MSTTQTITEGVTRNRTVAAIDQKLEIVVIPVSDVDRAKRFYEGLGWRLDAEFANGEDWRIVQLTPPGSSCSVIIGKGVTTAVPGSLQGVFLVVDDVQAARTELIARGVDVSEVFHFEQTSCAPSRHRDACRVPTRTVARIFRSRHLPIRMATAGSSRRSRLGFRDEDLASTWPV